MKKITKIVISLLLCIPVVLGFVACGKKEEPEAKSIVKKQTKESSLTLIAPKTSMDSFYDLFADKRFKLGVIDEKSNDNFYDIILNGSTYENGGIVVSGTYDLSDVENTEIYEYFEISGLKSTFFKNGDVYSLAKPSVDFTSFEDEESTFVGNIKNAENIYRKLNWNYVLFNDKNYNSSYKLVDVQEDVVGVNCLTSADVDFTIAQKYHGVYTFLTKPMPILSNNTLNIYDFKYTKTGDVYLRVYTDANYGVTLGADQIIKENIDGVEVTLYQPLYRTFFSVYDID